MKSHKTFRFGIRPTDILPVLLIPALMIGLLPLRAGAATLIVTNTADPGVGGCTASGSGDGCTLREALTAANNQTLTPGADTIDATGINGSITLATALPRLNTNLTLNGPGAANLTVQRSSLSGTPEFRIFTIDNTTTTGPIIVLSGLTIAKGKVSGSNAPTNCGGGIYNNHGTLTVNNTVLKSNSAINGGAICNDGSLSVNATLTLNNSTITTNVATEGGGGLFNNGSRGGSTPLAISKCIFTNNRAAVGGAILNDGHAGGSATITKLSNSVLSDNTASGNGGAIENNGTAGGSATLVISYSTLSANTAVSGGGVDNNGVGGSATQAISYSTFDANSASANGGAINNVGGSAGSATLAVGTSTFHANTAAAKGGAILSNGAGGSATAEIDNSTFKANVAAANSAAIDWDGTGGSATLALGSVILANSPSANLFASIINAQTTFTSKNHNLSSDAAGGNSTSAPGGPYLTAGGDIRNTDPKFDAAGLTNNGGPTQTIALQAGSPALDQGISSLSTDQRGFSRPIDNPAIVNASGGDGSDIGAYERSNLNVSINDVTITEGNTGTNNATFTITLSAPNSQTVSVNAITANGSAKSPSDYTGGGASLVFSPGQTSKTFSVPVVGDALDEDTETFFVLLSSPVNTGIARGRGICTINDNDLPPSIRIENVEIGEGDGGQRTMVFRLLLSAPSGKLVKVNYATANGTAIAGNDYVAVASTQIAFTTGQTVTLARVVINSDIMNEPNETFKVDLTNPIGATISDSQALGTILNDDSAPSLTINDVSIAEGNTATKQVTFTVTLSKTSGQNITVNFATADGVARSTSDYLAKTSTLSFSPSSALTRTVSIVINGDTAVEGDETLFVILSGATNASIGRARGTGTINNDDSSG